jgi:DNA polymerase-3 subunit delta'
VSFKEIIGQESAVALLKRAAAERRVAHAYVFVGPQGSGRKKTALNFAKLLLCADALNKEEPCDACSSCVKADNANHPDIHRLSCDGPFIKIDAVREACRCLSLKGFESSYKVLIVDEAQCLNEESSNALLKTLEEPSRQTVIILIAPTLKSVLPTIASRCQRIIFTAFNQEVLEQVLQERFHIGRHEAVYLSRMTQGSLGRALQYHENQLFDRKNKIIKDVLDASLRLDDVMDLSKQERFERDKKIDEALGVLSSWFRDLLVARFSEGAAHFINSDRRDDLLRCGRVFTLAEIENRIAAIAQTGDDIERNVNARIALTKMRVELWKS